MLPVINRTSLALTSLLQRSAVFSSGPFRLAETVLPTSQMTQVQAQSTALRKENNPMLS